MTENQLTAFYSELKTLLLARSAEVRKSRSLEETLWILFHYGRELGRLAAKYPAWTDLDRDYLKIWGISPE